MCVYRQNHQRQHISFLYVVLLCFGSNQKIHCCHSIVFSLFFKMLSLCPCLCSPSFHQDDCTAFSVHPFCTFIDLVNLRFIFIRFYCYHFGIAGLCSVADSTIDTIPVCDSYWNIELVCLDRAEHRFIDSFLYECVWVLGYFSSSSSSSSFSSDYSQALELFNLRATYT